MKHIKLWSVEGSGANVTAVPVEEAANTESEAMLEDLLVGSPHLLEAGLNLIGRQVPTSGGPLDLLGVDQDGRLTVFELKRGTLTRDAVAQALDYASDLATYDLDRLASLVQEFSGRLGIEKIDDFVDWYGQTYSGSIDALQEAPRIVLVGLGVDERARRIVHFLAERGAEIRLLTFHGFRRDGGFLLAREADEALVKLRTRETTTAGTKAKNREILLGRAKELGIQGLLERVRLFLDEQVGGYCWPGKTAYSFSLQERTGEGRPTWRSYVTLYTMQAPTPGLSLCFYPRAMEAAGGEATENLKMLVAAKSSRSKSYPLELRIAEAEWEAHRDHLTPFLEAMVTGWRRKTSEAAEMGA